MHPGTTPTTATGSNSRGESAAAEKEKFPRLERHPNPQVPRPTPPHAATARGSDAAIFSLPPKNNSLIVVRFVIWVQEFMFLHSGVRGDPQSHPDPVQRSRVTQTHGQVHVLSVSRPPRDPLTQLQPSLSPDQKPILGAG